MTRTLIPQRLAPYALVLLLTFGVCVTALSETTNSDPPAPNLTPQQIPAGWTAAEAKQWLLPNQTAQNGGYTQADAAYVQQHLTFLKGHRLDCKNILGSALQCCKKTVPDQQQAWWKRYSETQKQTSTVSKNKLIAHVQGQWSQMKDGANSFTLDAPLTSDSENIKGGGSGPSSTSTNGSLRVMNDAFMANENANVKPHLGWYCDDSDFDTAVGKNLGECHYLGSKCDTSVLGICIIKKEEYCCFNSPTSRILREQFLKNGVGDMGTAKSPKCAGISMADLQSGKIGETDTAEVIARMQLGGYLPNDVYSGNEAQIRFTGSGNGMGDPSRLIVSDRTANMVGKMDPSAATSSINADAMTVLPTATVAAPTGPGNFTFSSGYQSFTSGKPLVIGVARDGSLGMVSVTVSTQDGTAHQGTDYNPVNQTLYWGDGDLAQKTVTITTVPFTSGGPRTLTLVLSAPTGSAQINPYATMNIDLQPEGH